jgi:hypothetical protein
MKKINLALAILLFSLSGLVNAQIGCDRACLEGHISTYLDALIANNARGLPLASNAKISTNNKLGTVAEGFWNNADEVIYRWDIANTRRGDVATESVIRNSDGSVTMIMVRLKVAVNTWTEVEVIYANEGDSDRIWGPEQILDYPLSENLTKSIRPVDRDSYYALIAATEGYWRAFQTNGTDEYRAAEWLYDARRYENGMQTTGLFPDGTFRPIAQGFEEGRYIGRNLWDRRYPVVDEERGIVLSIVRFGIKAGMESQSVVTSNNRLVGEFFQINAGKIQEIQAVLTNIPDAVPSVWEADYGPGVGGW